MDEEEKHFHFVSTREEARRIIDDQERYWVSNCGCREGGSGCERSRMDLCLFFDTAMTGTGTDFREVDHAFVEGILEEAEEKHLVCRPFRYMDDRTRIQGICFCCDDCCYYFTADLPDPVNEGTFIERTDMEACTQCGVCTEVCYFGARVMNENTLTIIRENCYGCGLCVDVCSVDCIEMEEREY